MATLTIREIDDRLNALEADINAIKDSLNDNSENLEILSDLHAEYDRVAAKTAAFLRFSQSGRIS